jgi:hypothetical protein
LAEIVRDPIATYRTNAKENGMKMRINVLMAGIIVSGCQTTMLSNDRIASDTSGVIGVPVTQLTISDRSQDGPTNTTYIARDTTSGAAYTCVINGGGLLAAGMTNPPTCTKK